VARVKSCWQVDCFGQRKHEEGVGGRGAEVKNEKTTDDDYVLKGNRPRNPWLIFTETRSWSTIQKRYRSDA
jgi:hypothetical protein